MPAWSPWSPRTIPGRFARLGTFPQREVGRMLFAAMRFCTSPGQHLCQTASTQLSVVFVLGAVEIDVSIQGIGVPLFNQRPDDVLHFLNVLSGVRKMIDPIDGHRFQVIEVVLRHLFGKSFNRHLLFVRAVDQLVVNIGDVDNPGYLVAAIGQVPFDRVENDGPDHVPDMGWFIDRRSAQIHFHLARFDRLKIFFLARQRVVNAKWHSSVFPVDEKES